uniref:Protein kinase c conserved region 2 n=1 Tax=Xenopsylla cheopis TaxID=163159 RepID=A0A6M2DDS9_XENCH
MDVQVDRNAERRNRVMLGPLPNDFLRISTLSEREQQEAADQQAALALQQQLSASARTQYPSPYYQNASGWLNITITQAKLVKNYGMTRMDPYVRLRIGHNIYETHTDPNGGKNPRWNKVMQCVLPKGINSIYLEIYDECSFTMDELIAWANIILPPAVLKGETREEWFPLSGKQGEGLEGMLHLVLSFSVTPTRTMGVAPVMVSSGYGAVRPTPVYVQAPPDQGIAAAAVPAEIPQQPVLTAEQKEQLRIEDLKQLGEMFPHLDKDVIKSVYEANRCLKEPAINSLLQLTE